MEHEDKTLIDILTGTQYQERDRVHAVIVLVSQSKQYVRALTLLLGGLFLKSTDKEMNADIMAAKGAAEEVVSWLSAHHAQLAQCAAPKQENRDEELITLH